MMIYHHHFRRFGPLIRWRLEQEKPPAGIIAAGWAVGKTAAWDQSIAAIPRSADIDAETIARGMP